jgi:hypothetical protein
MDNIVMILMILIILLTFYAIRHDKNFNLLYDVDLKNLKFKANLNITNDEL